MPLITRHPVFGQLTDLATDVLRERQPPGEAWACGHTAQQLVLELYHFLAVKQLLLRTRPSGAAEDSLKVSPGFMVDALWHAVLLETEVRESLESLMGGHVPHSAADARNLSDEQKLARQLTALNCLAAEGWTPHLCFWQQPGTAMHKVEEVSSNGWTLFFARGMSVAAVAEVTRNFLSSTSSCWQTSAFLATLRAAEAAAGAAEQATSGGGGGGPWAPGSLHLTIVALIGKTTDVTVPAAGTVAHIMGAIQDKEGIPPDQQRLVYAGNRLCPYDRLDQIQLTSGAVVHLVLRLSGC